MSEQTGARGPQPARRTPYELVFGAAEIEEHLFARIRTEAAAQGVDPRYPERFAFLSTAGEVVRELVPGDTPPEALEQYRALLHQGYNFWVHGKPLYLVEPALARYLVEGAPGLEGWAPALPAPACYVQLPQNLFWGSISPDTPPEPLDGFFLTAAEADDPAGAPVLRLEALGVLGVRRDRAGFSVIPFSTEVGPGVPAPWEAPGRESGRDFETVLPGGELQGYYSVLTTTEALKLLARVLWYLDRYPDDAREELPAEHRADDRPGSPPRSLLPYRRLTLGRGTTGG